MTYLLDTSALAAHFLNQTGAAQVDQLIAEAPSDVGVCVLAWFELRYVLHRCGVSEKDSHQALALYRELPMTQVSISMEVVQRAMDIRDATPQRLPLADALMAACASLHHAVLVHRDSHYAPIPARYLRQLML